MVLKNFLESVETLIINTVNRITRPASYGEVRNICSTKHADRGSFCRAYEENIDMDDSSRSISFLSNLDKYAFGGSGAGGGTAVMTSILVFANYINIHIHVHPRASAYHSQLPWGNL